MKFEVVIPFWVLSLSYWVHLLATVIWLGGLFLMALIAWPAVKGRVLDQKQWVELRRRFSPWANGSLVVLWVTGLLQMTADENYSGFLQVDSLWTGAILAKHLAVLAMMGLALYIQWWVHPAIERLALLAGKKPELAAAEQEKLAQREIRLLRLNLACAAAVLLLTAIATAV
ncbi:MAG: CopD family protein [Chloroflexi bacterium]|nr:CopD family protein [Chloroflexota bacterium]MCI0578293.1 CopD family protein [Chloroflexota bacterium]MCI0648758.1 CopD family protein [Chloroflexota bacterium]MCI0727226.1 CopD family protein [Chloroflexota bacterium]